MSQCCENCKPGVKFYLPRLSNQRLLQVTTCLFLLFVIAEFIGSIRSNSLSLLGDASAMSIDVVAYLCNMIAEYLKRNSSNDLSAGTNFTLTILVPLFSIMCLLVVTSYIIYDAIIVLRKPPKVDDVSIEVLYTFSGVNLLIDIICSVLFLARAKDIFDEPSLLPHIHVFMESSVELADEDFSHNDEDLIHEVTTETPVTISFANCCNKRGRDYCSFFYSQSTHYTTVCGVEISHINTSPANTAVPITNSRKNFNMISAFSHIGGDSLRTLSVIIAATISLCTGIDGDIMDAVAAIFVSVVIVVAIFPLLISLYYEARNDYSWTGRSEHLHYQKVPPSL